MLNPGSNMTKAIKVDSLRLAEELKKAHGDPRQTARAITDAVLNIDTTELATKSDMAVLRSDMAELEVRLIRHFYVVAFGIVGLTVTLMKYLP